MVDDEPAIAAIAGDYLRHDGFSVLIAATGEEGLALARGRRPDLIVLDLTLPGVSGIDVATTLRRESKVPIIILTARVEEDDRLHGLEVGADDYMTKPFSPRELVARVRAVLRRAATPEHATTLRVRDAVLDVARMSVMRGTTTVALTTTEFHLLAAMARRPGRVFTRAELLDAVRSEEGDVFDRAIDAHVKNIRRKLEHDPRAPQYVLTVYGVGYKCADE